MSVSRTESPKLLKADLYLASSLCDGVEDNNLKQVTTLLKSKEADPNVLMPLHGITPFHLVIGNDSESFAEEVTKLFLRYGGNPNVKSIDGMTPVHVAAAWGRTTILDLLLANGGDPLCLDNDCCSPFTYAFQGEHNDAVEVLSKYCVNDEIKEESFKYKLELDKVIVNNGEVLAEYLVSDNSLNSSYRSASFLSNDDRYYDSNRCGYAPESGSSDSNSMNSDFVTVRKNQRKRVATVKTNNVSETQEKQEYDFNRDTVQEELQLLNEIISKLSNSLTSEIDTSNKTFQSYESECMVGCKTSSPKRMQMSMTFNRVEKCNYSNNKYNHSEQNLSKNNISNKTLQIIKKHNNVPKLKDSRFMSKASKVNAKKAQSMTKKIIVSTRMSSTSSSAKVITPSQSKPKTPIKDTLLHSNWLDETIISKSPNLYIDIEEGRKSKLLRTPTFEKKSSPLHTKINKKPSTFTPNKVKSKSPNKSNKCQTPVSRIPRPKKYFITPTNVKTVVRKSTGTPSRLSKPKVGSSKEKPAGRKERYFSPLNITYSMSESSSLSRSSDYRSKNPEERRKSLKEVAVNLSNRMDEEDIPKNKVSNNYKNLNAELNELLQNSEFISGVHMLDSEVKTKLDSKTDYTTNEESPRVRHSNIEQNQEVIDSLSNANSISKLSDVNISSLNRQYDDPFNSLMVQHGSSLSLSSESYVSASNVSDALLNNMSNSTSYNNGEEIRLAVDNLSSSSQKVDSESFLSIEEEYKYEDLDEGVAFLERRLCVSPSFASSNMSSSFYSISTVKSEPLPKELYLLDNVALRERLKNLGEAPGPITNTTYHLYLKRLHKLECGRKVIKPVHRRNVPNTNAQPRTSIDSGREHLRPSLLSIDWVQNLDEFEAIEHKVFQEFVNPHPSRKWREGTTKGSFNYLLLDPRITKDLPRRAANLSLSEKWETFLSAIFYVGKGKQSRPYAHLYDAFKSWVSKDHPRSNNSKIQRILDIWNEGKGVVVLHVFHNTIPVEAYTREAVMIEVLGTNKLGNCKCGDYYGVVATWRSREKCELGRYMLFKAMQILLLEGERQIFPDNL